MKESVGDRTGSLPPRTKGERVAGDGADDRTDTEAELASLDPPVLRFARTREASHRAAICGSRASLGDRAFSGPADLRQGLP